CGDRSFPATPSGRKRKGPEHPRIRRRRKYRSRGILRVFRQYRRSADALGSRPSRRDQSNDETPSSSAGSPLADSRTPRKFIQFSIVAERREGPLTKARTTWRWNPVRGEYEAGHPPPLHGTGEISAIQAFSDKTMLLLGGTGFVGKVLLAMVLDRFPELKHLVVLARRKKNLSGEERFYTETLQSPPLKVIVDRIGGESVVRRKLKVVEGDLDEPLCGISAQDVEELQGK